MATTFLAGKSYRPRLITRTQRHTDDASTFTQKTSIVYDEAIGYKKEGYRKLWFFLAINYRIYIRYVG